MTPERSEKSPSTRVRRSRFRRERFVESVEAGASFNAAAKAIGVTSRAVRKWREADPDFNEAVQEARCRVDDQVEQVAYERAIDPNPANNALRQWWLKCRRSEVYGDRIDQSGRAKPEGTIRYVDNWRGDHAGSALDAQSLAGE